MNACVHRKPSPLMGVLTAACYIKPYEKNGDRGTKDWNRI